MNKEEFYKIISKSKNECDGFEMHIQYLWENNNAKSIFSITGLDFGHILTGPVTSGIIIKNPKEKGLIYYT